MSIPGMEQKMWFKANETGGFDIVCAELCGWGHYKMKGRVFFLPRDEYERSWTKCGANRTRCVSELPAEDDESTSDSATTSASPNMGRVGRLNFASEIIYEYRHRSIPIPTPTASMPTPAGFLKTYVFSLDHKIIGLQFLFSTLIWFFVGGMLGAGHSLAVGLPVAADADPGQPAVGAPKGGRSRPRPTRCSSPCTRR